jgi:hypothetical protein
MSEFTSIGPLSRRALLSTLGTVTVAGCLSEDDPPTPGLDEIYIRNSLDRKVDAVVTVFKSDEQVYDRTHTLAAFDGYAPGSVVIEEPWMHANERYEVQVDVASFDENTFKTEHFLEMAGGVDDIACFDLSVEFSCETIGFYVGANETCSQPGKDE